MLFLDHELLNNILKTERIPITGFSQIMEVSRESVYKWMRGTCQPEQDKIKKIVEFFNCEELGRGLN